MTTRLKSAVLRFLTAPLLLIVTVQEIPAQRVFSFTQYAKVTPAPDWSIFSGAFTANTRIDLAAYHPSDGSVWVGRNTGTAFTFVQYATVSPPAGWRFVAGEFTGDGLTDLAAYHPSDGSVWVGRNTGSKFKFTQYATISPGPEWSFVAGDFTGDGLIDIGAYHPRDGSVWVGSNRGSNFKFVQYATISPGPEWSFIAGDFNGDGLADFGAYHPSDGSVWVGANRGSSFKFVQYATISPGAKWSFATGEFTGDSAVDLAAIYADDGSVWIGRNRGSSFKFTQYATVSPAVGLGLVSGYFAGDGLGDLGLYYPTDGSIWVGRNRVSSQITLTSPAPGYSTTAKSCPVAPCTALVDFKVQVSGPKPESVSLVLKRASGAESTTWLCTPPDPIEQIPGCATPPLDLSRSVHLTPDTWTVVAKVKRNGVEEVTPPVTFTVHPPGATSVGPVTLKLASPNEAFPGIRLRKAPAGVPGGGEWIEGSTVDIIGKNLNNNDFIRDQIFLSPIPPGETSLTPQSALPLGNWCLYKAEFVSRQALGGGESKLSVRLPELPLQTPSECGVPQSPSGSIFTTKWRWVIRDPWIRPERVHSSWAIPSPRRDSAFGLPPFRLIKPPYPNIYGFGFQNQHTSGTYNEFLTVFGNSAYHCVDCLPVIGCACIAPRIPDPVYHLLWWPLYKVLIDTAFRGSCAGMASTSLLMARGELNPQSFDPDVLFPAGFTDAGDPAEYKKSNFCTPICSPPKPANLWATIRMNHGAQLSREFLAEIIDILGESVLDPNNVTSIKGVPNATLERVRKNPLDYVVCMFGFSGGHCVTPYRVEGSKIHIYDNKAPHDDKRYIEISGGDYDYPARRTDKSEPNHGNGIWAFPISLWKNARHVTGVEGLRSATGLKFALMALGGDADMHVTNSTGGRWGREDDGKISDSLRGAIAVPVFGALDGAPRNIPLLLAMSQPAPTIRITPKSGRYVFQTAEGGHTLQLEGRAVSAGGRQLVRLGYTGGQLSSMDLTAQNTASRVVPRVGMSIAEGESVVFHWLGLDLPAGRSAAFTADRNTQSVSYRNTTGSPTRHMLLADYSAKKHGRMSYGPFEVPAGAAHRVSFAAWPAPDMLISEVDLNADGRPDRTETVVGNPVSPTENPDASVDLAIESPATPSGAEGGRQVAYTVTVKNLGPAPATNVSVIGGISAGENVSVHAANGSCTMTGNGLKCQLNDLPVGGKTTINFLVRTTAPGSGGTSLTAFANQTDDDWTNNSITLSIPKH